MQRCRQTWAEKITASLVLGIEAVAVKWNGYEKLQWICEVSVFLLRQAVSFCKSQKFDGKDMQIYAKRYAMINKLFLLGVLVCSIARNFSLLLQTASHTTWVWNSSCSFLQSLGKCGTHRKVNHFCRKGFVQKSIALSCTKIIYAEELLVLVFFKQRNSKTAIRIDAETSLERKSESILF